MIHYVIGNATKPRSFSGQNLICHVCNDSGGWGRGFVLALSARWKDPESYYRMAYSARRDGRFYLGLVQVIKVEDDISVANMVAQRGYSTRDKAGLDYDALETCLKTVAFYLKSHPKTSVVMPRIGCGLAGGSWDRVEPLIEKCLGAYDVFVYDLKEKA